MVDTLYNPIVRANIMTKSFARTYLGNEQIAPTTKTFRVRSCEKLECLGHLHDVSVYYDNVVMGLDFYVFDVLDFDILIGHPLEKLFADLSKTGELDIKLGMESFSIQVTRAKNSVAEPPPDFTMPMEVMSVAPFESPELSLEKDVESFIEEKDYSGETIELPKEEART
jgi:hypothetical protein